MKLEVGDAHEGIKAAAARVPSTTWQRCCVHFQRNALAHAGKSSRRVASPFIATAFAQPDPAAARAQWRRVADQTRAKLPRLAALMEAAEEDVLACMTFPKRHRAKIHSTNLIERPNGENKRRADVVGILPNEVAIRRLVGVSRRPRTGGGSAAHPHKAGGGMSRPEIPLHDSANPRPAPRPSRRQPGCRADRLTSSAVPGPVGTHAS